MQRAGGAHYDGLSAQSLLNGRQLGLRIDTFAQQMAAKTLVASVGVADAQIVDGVALQHLANLIHSAIGVAHQQHRLLFGHGFAHHELQSHARFARPRGAYEQKIVLRLKHFLNQCVVHGVVRAT